ncbi:hypothetical protein R5R35_013044 [Gryllus longicercus]|uniref:Uncharacterized protein n=1 Tax=Gryllus longicercus TaxID=2509291 RepID=A0AAN9V8V7_9ORTH
MDLKRVLGSTNLLADRTSDVSARRALKRVPGSTNLRAGRTSSDELSFDMDSSFEELLASFSLRSRGARPRRRCSGVGHRCASVPALPRDLSPALRRPSARPGASGAGRRLLRVRSAPSLSVDSRRDSSKSGSEEVLAVVGLASDTLATAGVTAAEVAESQNSPHPPSEAGPSGSAQH